MKQLRTNEDIDRKHDPMGRAISDYFTTGKAAKLRVFSPTFDEDEIPVPMLFRTFEEMPFAEQKALDLAKGRTLDVGAGSGCHSLVLQHRGIDVTAIDISHLSVLTMQQRGVKKVFEQDFFTLTGQFDTILMLMNGIGIVGTLNRLPAFFQQLDKILAPGGQLLCDSSDISFIYENEDGRIEYPEDVAYFGEIRYLMRYKDTIGESFPWLYIDANTLRQKADENGYSVEVLFEGEHYEYLAKITKK